MPGKTLFWKARYISSSYWDMTANPWIAFVSYVRVFFTVRIRLLNLAISWSKTMERECIWPSSFVIKWSWLPAASIKRAGTFYINCWAISVTISSGVFPLPALLTLGWIDKIVSIILLDYWFWYVILAFSCIPKTSGS